MKNFFVDPKVKSKSEKSNKAERERKKERKRRERKTEREKMDVVATTFAKQPVSNTTRTAHTSL
jgi:hypothetical protein